MKVKKALSLLSIKHNRPNLEIDNFNSEVDFDLNTHLESCLRLLYELDHSDLTLEEIQQIFKAQNLFNITINGQKISSENISIDLTEQGRL